ncbi:MAG: GNAT family N-acetyltransferase [Pseudomonadales bacterium]|nr:GNAT family N-acetyltransferase [Pseudomonadales bacterium]
MPIAVEKMTPADADAVAGLVEQYWRFEKIGGYSRPAITTLLERFSAEESLGIGLVARSDDCTVGYLLVVFVFSLEHKGLTAEVDEFYVAANWRSGGVGLELLEEAERICTEAGCTSISLQLGAQNADARRFYLRRGYVPRVGFDLLEKPLSA